MQTLEQQLTAGINMNFIPIEVPSYIHTNLNPAFAIRPYQLEAFARFKYVSSDYQHTIIVSYGYR